MTKKKKPPVSTCEISIDMYNALVTCHRELREIYSRFGDIYEASKYSKALELSEPFEDCFIEDANYVVAVEKDKIKNDKKGKNKVGGIVSQRINQIDSATELFFKANRDNMNDCFSRFSYLKLKEVTERVLEAVDEAGQLDHEASVDDDFMDACGDDLSFQEVIMYMEEDMNIQMPDDFTNVLCKIKKLTIEDFSNIIYKAGQRSY